MDSISGVERIAEMRAAAKPVAITNKDPGSRNYPMRFIAEGIKALNFKGPGTRGLVCVLGTRLRSYIESDPWTLDLVPAEQYVASTGNFGYLFGIRLLSANAACEIPGLNPWELIVAHYNLDSVLQRSCSIQYEPWMTYQFAVAI